MVEWCEVPVVDALPCVVLTLHLKNSASASCAFISRAFEVQ